MQLFPVIAQEQRLVRAAQRRVALAECAIDQEVAHGSGLDAVNGLQELLELREPEQGPHCRNPRRGTTPCRTSTVARRSLPVFIHRS